MHRWRSSKLSVSDFTSHAHTLWPVPTSLSVYVTRQLMRQLAPSLLWMTLHDIDIAHAGAYSLYIDGIRRTDRLCADIWKTIQSEPEYAGKTTLFILPDFGRDPTTTPAATASSTIAPAMRSLVPPG